jgi:hypothetical protein
LNTSQDSFIYLPTGGVRKYITYILPAMMTAADGLGLECRLARKLVVFTYIHAQQPRVRTWKGHTNLDPMPRWCRYSRGHHRLFPASHSRLHCYSIQRFGWACSRAALLIGRSEDSRKPATRNPSRPSSRIGRLKSGRQSRRQARVRVGCRPRRHRRPHHTSYTTAARRNCGCGPGAG